MNLFVWSLENKHLMLEGLRKPTLRRCWDSVVLVAMGLVFLTFGVLETGLKFIDFRFILGPG